MYLLGRPSFHSVPVEINNNRIRDVCKTPRCQHALVCRKVGRAFEAFQVILDLQIIVVS